MLCLEWPNFTRMGREVKIVAEIIHKELSYKIMGILFDVHNALGGGYQEKYYQKAIRLNLLEKKIKDIRHFNIVSCALYFHNAKSENILDFIVRPFKDDKRYQNFLKYNIDLIGRDNLNDTDLNKIFRNRYLKADRQSFLFTDDIYASFKRFLKPPIHLKEDGLDFNYSPKQNEIIYESNKKQQRIKGVVGSGKTTVLAARAIQAHKRTNGRVLILTYNITLRNYIKDKISEIRENFPWDSFVISNYHLFINSELNNLGIPVKVPDDFDKFSHEQKNEYFEKNFYSNIRLFKDCVDFIKTYDVILVDEIQDYKRPWMEILKDCFLSENGEYVLFGDVKQNIYNNAISGKDVVTNVMGVTELKRCFRSEFKIKDLAIQYQKEIFKDKYEIDSFNIKEQSLEIRFERNQLGTINYIYLQSDDIVPVLYNIIHENAINKDIPPNDITILANSISMLKEFETFYRYASNEKTNTMFETNEIMYRMGLNYVKKDKPKWLCEGIKLIKRENDRNMSKALNQLSTLFTLNDLYNSYPDKFKDKLKFYCYKFRTTLELFTTYIENNKNEVAEFKKYYNESLLSNDFKMIRNNKKIHFYMNSGTIKVSTIHSFKGWESELLFLIIEKKFSKMDATFDEILYTGITRCRSNLVLINFGNEQYHNKLKDIIKKVR